MLLTDHQIRDLCKLSSAPLLEPFSEPVSENNVISYGVTSAGYDLRCGNTALIVKSTFCGILDPKRFKEEDYKRMVFDEAKVDFGYPIFLSPHSYVLVSSMEYFRVPRHLAARCVGKSTWARCGLIVNTTPLEPEWEGYLTIEIANVSPCTVPIYPGEGIAQVQFEVLASRVETSYKDKKGKYQGQIGITPAKVR